MSDKHNTAGLQYLREEVVASEERDDDEESNDVTRDDVSVDRFHRECRSHINQLEDEVCVAKLIH